MLSNTQKILSGLALMGIISVVMMPDVVMGLLFELVHFFFELLFISFEGIESFLDTVVEHLLHTELHQTQVIVFYLIVIIAALPFYYLWRLLRRLFFRLKNALHAVHAEWILYKTRATDYWLSLSLIGKSTLVAILAVAIYLVSWLFF
ncbi:MAG: hypothetical protein PHG00_08830 [Methylococcales bacterium]|nr:hypothetical protein [Methylococcales bacterium]